MLSIFPTLLDYWLIAPVILRLALGLTLVYGAYTARREQKFFALAKLLAGALLVIGLFTQIAAIISALLIIAALSKKPVQYQLLILELAIALSLLVLGPGFIAIDLPL